MKWGLIWTLISTLFWAAVVVGGTFIYIHVIEGDAPARLSLETTPTVNTVPSDTSELPLAGNWTIATGSTAGYRAKEKLFTQSNTAVGRTSKITGSIKIVGTKATAASFVIDMTSVKSVGNKIDSSLIDQRDRQFQGRIMDTAQFPTATFVLTTPINLAPIPKNGVVKSYSATGKLTLHGTTKTVTIPITARRTANVIGVQGILPITFSDYGINNPSGGPATVGNVGQMEFLLQLAKS